MIGIGKNLARRPTANVWSSGADLDFMFAEDASGVPRAGRAQLQCTRAGDTATVFNRYGVLETVLANTPRLNHDPSVLRYENAVTWSEDFSHASWNRANATVSADPVLDSRGKLTARKVIPTAANGSHYVDKNIAGTYVDGEQKTWSVDLKADGYDRVQVLNYYAIGSTGGDGVVVNLTTGTISGDSDSFEIEPLPNGWYRVSIINTVKYAAAYPSNVICRVVVLSPAGAPTFAGDGVSGVLVSRAQFNSGGVLEYRATGASPQPKEYQCLGQLVEESRLNGIRNNTMQGVVAGTPGTLPTNWSMTASANGITRSVVGSGVEDGISYVDLAFAGTATAAMTFYLNTESLTQNAAAMGQAWNSSLFVRRLTGTLPGREFTLNTSGRTSVGGASSDNAWLTLAPDGSPLRVQRFDKTITMAFANTAYVGQFVAIGFNSGEVANLTLRVGMPQLEQGAFATSVVPTSGAAVWRGSEFPRVLTDGWFNPTEGTLLVEFEGQSSATDIAYAASFNTGSSASGFIGFRLSTVAQFRVDNDSAQQVTTNTSGFAPGEAMKMAAAFKLNDFAVSLNGAAALTDSAGTLPIPTQLSLGGLWNDGSLALNGHIRRVAYWRRRAANTDLQQLTA